MMNRRTVAIKIIRALFLTMLLFSGVNVTPRGRIDSNHEKNVTLRSAPAPVSAAQVSSDGLIAFSADDQIYVMNADGSDVRLLTDGLPGTFRYPALSPDGNRLAFIRDDKSLYVMGTDGSHMQLLAYSHVALGEPAWSPDGTMLAFVRGYDTTSGGYANITSCGQEIYVLYLSSGIEVNLTKGLGGTDPAWSPDGTRIAFSSARDDDYEIYTMGLDGKDIEQLTKNIGSAEAEPAWSPDGKQIAYAANLLHGAFLCGFMPTPRPPGVPDESTAGVYVMSPDGTDQTLLEGTEGGIEPAWSPDGTSLALVINGKGDGQIYVATGGARPTKLTSDATQKSSPSWSQSSPR